MSKQIRAEKAQAFEDLESQGYILESISNDGNKILELWHHPCFTSDKDNGKCTHKAVSGDWRKVLK